MASKKKTTKRRVTLHIRRHAEDDCVVVAFTREDIAKHKKWWEYEGPYDGSREAPQRPEQTAHLCPEAVEMFLGKLPIGRTREITVTW